MPEGKLPPDFALVMVPSVVIFLGLFTSPIWYNAAFGSAEWERPAQVAASAGNECVLSAEMIRVEHMELLDNWRDQAVRDGERSRGEATKSGGGMDRFGHRSLTNTCLGCHTDREVFCDRCHTYAGEDPYCWDCHVNSGQAPQRSAERREGSE